VHFAAPPPLVEVGPGVQVVRDCDEEVFFTGGYYWYADAHGTWFRSRSHRGGWVMAPGRVVPMRLARIDRGHYRHWHGGERRWERHEARQERREERREEHFERHHGRH
jgi:hypothetical protein